MKIQILVKQASIGLAASGFLWAGSAIAQTPVSTSVHLSGSCAKCDLSHRVMPGMSLEGANFAGSDFSYSNLAGANFNHANLDNTSFYKAHLMRVRGERVNLNKSIFRGTTLSEVNLMTSNFVLADFDKADLTDGNFTRGDFTKARLRNADAIGAVFARANFTKARLDHSDFTRADFSGAQFVQTAFGDAIVSEANFSGANLSGAIMANLTGLSQEQLDVACGSADTVLPDGLDLRDCPPKAVMAEANVEARTDTFFVETQPNKMARRARILPLAPPTAMRPLVQTPDARRKTITIRAKDLDDVMREIDSALAAMPTDSPYRPKLERSKRKLQAVQASSNR